VKKLFLKLVLNTAVFIFWIFLIVPTVLYLKEIGTWRAFFSFFIFLYFNVYIHEFGHVLAAIVVRIPIRRVTIGNGREILRKRIGRIIVVITNGFSGGNTFIGPISKKLFKIRCLIIFLGGVVSQLISIVLVMLIFDIQFNELINIKHLSFSHAFIYSNLLLIVLNLIPRKILISGIPVSNDGLQIIKLPFITSYETQEILSAGKHIETYELYENKQFNEAEIGYKECIELYPIPLLPKLNLSATYIKQLKIEETIALLEPLKETYKDDPYKFLLYNNLAWAYMLKFEEQALEKADEYSKIAFQLCPQSQYAINTRGCVLIEKGEFEDGIGILRKTINIRKRVDKKTNNPVNFIYIAYGHYLKGEYLKALKYARKVEINSETLDLDDKQVFRHVIVKTENFKNAQKTGRKECEISSSL